MQLDFHHGLLVALVTNTAVFGRRCAFFVTGDRRDFGHHYGQTVQDVEGISVLPLAEVLSGS